jgi:hypothetical protein
MAVNVSLKLNLDDSNVKKKLDDLRRASKKGMSFGQSDDSKLKGTASLQNKFDKAMDKASKALNDLANSTSKIIKKQNKKGAWEGYGKPILKGGAFVGGKVGRFAGAAAEGIHTGSSLLTRGTSGQSEYTSGGFMSSVHDKISFGQDVYAKSKEGYTSIKDAYKGQAEVKDENGNVTQKARKGGVAAAALAGIPVVGGLLGGIVGGIMKQVDDMGKEWTSVMASQSGTTAATGGYVSGGGGLFQNSQMAQAQIAFNRTQSRFGNEGAFNEKNAMQFAAQQNIGIAQYAEQLGQIKEQDADISTDFLRGAADINKMTGLKQGQFVAKLAGYSNSLKEAGFSKQNMSKFAAMTGGLVKTTGMTGERAATVGQQLDQGVRKGIGGGILGTLTLSKLMEQNPNMSMAEARELQQEGGLSHPLVQKAGTAALQSMGGDDVRAHIMEKAGLTLKEGRLLNGFNSANITDSTKELNPFINQSMKQTSDRQSAVAGSKAAAKAAHVGYLAGEAQLNAFETLAPAFEPIISLMEKAETELFAGVKDLTKEIQGMMDFMQKAQKEGVMKSIGEEIGKNIKLPWSR